MVMVATGKCFHINNAKSASFVFNTVGPKELQNGSIMRTINKDIPTLLRLINTNVIKEKKKRNYLCGEIPKQGTPFTYGHHVMDS